MEFHDSQPWILSASADQTVRIWSLLSRVCLRVLRGHTGPVSSASFHPTLPLVISASADTKVRLWKIGKMKLDGLDPHMLHAMSEDSEVVEAMALAGLSESPAPAPARRRRHRFPFGGRACHQGDDDRRPTCSRN